MRQINYSYMSDEELKQYFLQPREDQNALETYLNRLSERPQQIITTVDDPDFEAKIKAAIQQQVQRKPKKA